MKKKLMENIRSKKYKIPIQVPFYMLRLIYNLSAWLNCETFRTLVNHTSGYVCFVICKEWLGQDNSDLMSGLVRFSWGSIIMYWTLPVWPVKDLCDHYNVNSLLYNTMMNPNKSFPPFVSQIVTKTRKLTITKNIKMRGEKKWDHYCLKTVESFQQSTNIHFSMVYQWKLLCSFSFLWLVWNSSHSQGSWQLNSLNSWQYSCLSFPSAEIRAVWTMSGYLLL